MAIIVQCGDVVFVDLNPVQGSEQAGICPALVLQTDRANATSPNTIIAPFTSKIRAALLPSHVFVAAGDGGLRLDSVVLYEQVRVIDKQSVQAVWGHLSDERMAEVADGLRAALDIQGPLALAACSPPLSLAAHDKNAARAVSHGRRGVLGGRRCDYVAVRLCRLASSVTLA